jgi:hypothetical protein
VKQVAYSERQTPSVGFLIALSLSGPMVLLAALPFGLELALTLMVLVPSSLILTLYFSARKIVITQDELRAGSFRIPRSVIAAAKAIAPEQLRHELGPGLDARARLAIRGDLKQAVRIELSDPQDPTPYVLISTRNPAGLVSALGAGRS